MKETAGKIEIDRAARALLDGDSNIARHILARLINRTMAEGRLSEDLHRRDLAQMASDCMFMAAKKTCEDAGSELVMRFSSEASLPGWMKADLDRLGIRYITATTGDEQ